MSTIRVARHIEIDGTPEKRLFLSIISDYNLQTGLCELIDNALDHWLANGKKNGFTVAVILDAQRQLISVKDNAGGINVEDLRLLVAPGASGNKLGQQFIGIFGVGGKRAGVALGERVEIRTRHKKDKSYKVEITTDWLENESWHLPAFEASDIEPNTTIVDISMLRQGFDDEEIELIRTHISETYSWFIEEGCTITVNNIHTTPMNFNHWSYPPEFPPRDTQFDVYPTRLGKLHVTIAAGLISDRAPERENYGVYVYCNHRLIVKELRTRDVGYFVTSEAGVPHPDASLCRAIVHLEGPAELMPWNSSKNGLSYSHPAFIQIRPTLIELVKYFSSLSRRLKSDWEAKVFTHSRGAIETIATEEILAGKKIVLPKLPRVRKLPKIDELKIKNKKILDEKPWTLGLVESMGLIEIITKQNLQTGNRAALILLDSNFEIGLKEFIVNRTDLFPPQNYNDTKIASIFKARHLVINEVKQHINFTQTTLDKVNHYYGLRNKLIHERATVGITDNQIADYQKTIEKILNLLFKIKFT